MKKRILALVTASMMTLTMLAGCGSSGGTSKNSTDTGSAVTGSASEQGVNVEKNLLSVEITIPASQIESIDETLANAEEKGYTATANEDGSITYKLTKAQHKEMMDSMKQSFQESIDELISSGDYPSLKKITFNDDYTKADVVVDYDAYTNSLDMFSILAIGMIGPMYQYYNGVEESKVNTEVSLIEESSGEVKDTLNYPEDFPDEESAE